MGNFQIKISSRLRTVIERERLNKDKLNQELGKIKKSGDDSMKKFCFFILFCNLVFAQSQSASQQFIKMEPLL